MGFNFWVLWSLKILCGVRYTVKGLENIPKDQAIVILAKHQSTWETMFLQMQFHPTSTILKRELFRIPFFGWGLAALRPIPIDRSNPRKALKQVKTVGGQRLSEGNNVLVFPEGTRTPYGEVGNYARSGADIALASGVPLIPVAHNSGRCWPMHTLVKYPGTVTVSIGKPLDASESCSKKMTAAAKEWIEGEIASME
jgi:1-acyl-sn-glycerol-3-phosphate acyltransferase